MDQEALAQFVFAQTKFVFANFPKKIADFWENWPRETARARSVYSQIVILAVCFLNILFTIHFLQEYILYIKKYFVYKI